MLIISLGQEFGKGSAGQFWLGICRMVAVKAAAAGGWSGISLYVVPGPRDPSAEATRLSQAADC